MRKTSILLITLLLLSYFVNATVRFKDFWALFSNLQFALGFILTIPVLFIYAVMVSITFRSADTRDLKADGRDRVVLRFGLFLLIGLIQCAIVQFLLLGDVIIWIWETGYFIDDFPFFAIPLALYISMADDYPDGRVFWAKSDRQAPDNLWVAYREPKFLLEALRSDFTALEAEAVYCARLFDIVLIESFNKMFVAYLATGEKVVYNFPVSHLKKSTVGKWLLKTKSRYLVNMLYTHSTAQSWKVDKRVVLDGKVLQAILNQEDKGKIHEMLKISRYYEVKTKAFFKNMQQLESKGWDESVMSYATPKKKK